MTFQNIKKKWEYYRTLYQYFKQTLFYTQYNFQTFYKRLFELILIKWLTVGQKA